MKQTPGTIRNLIVKELHKHTGVPVIPEYEINKAPKYPYITYKISTPYDNTRNPIIKTTDVPGTNGFEKDTQETLYTQPKLHMTINAHSQDDIETIECAKSAMDWLMHKGRVELEDSNIVVVETGNIIDKTIHIINNYEQRFGFDVEIRYTDIVENTMDTIDSASTEIKRLSSQAETKATFKTGSHKKESKASFKTGTTEAKTNIKFKLGKSTTRTNIIINIMQDIKQALNTMK